MALRDSYSACVTAPESSSALALAICSAGPWEVLATSLDVPLLLGLPLRNRRPLPLGHAPAPRNEVYQCAQPRHEDEQDRPTGLRPTAERAVAEQVEQAAEPHHQCGDPDEEPEAPQENFPEVGRDRVHGHSFSRSAHAPSDERCVPSLPDAKALVGKRGGVSATAMWSAAQPLSHVRRGARSHRRIFGSRPPREARCGRHLRRTAVRPLCSDVEPLGRSSDGAGSAPGRGLRHSRSIRSWRRTLNQVAWVVQPAVRLYAFRIARHAAVAIRSSRDENRALSDLSEKLSQHAATRARWSARPFRDRVDRVDDPESRGLRPRP